MNPADVMRCMDTASRASREFEAMGKAARQIKGVSNVSRHVEAATRVRRHTAATARLFKAHGPLERAAAKEFDATRAVGLRHNAWAARTTHHQLTNLMREAKVVSTLPNYPEASAKTWAATNWDDILSKSFLDFRTFLGYYRDTGTIAAPWRGDGKPTIVLTYRDTRRCPYLAGLLRASGWRVIELHPYEDALITGLGELVLSSIPGSWERPGGFRSRAPSGPERRRRRRVSDSVTHTRRSRCAPRERGPGGRNLDHLRRRGVLLRRSAPDDCGGSRGPECCDAAPAFRAPLPHLVAR